MDQLPALGTAIGQVVRPTQQLYGSLLQPHAERIKSTLRKTFKYGSDARQNLDVYYPASCPSGAGCPILMFLYGGGLVHGAKIVPVVENELVYANLGHFFAEQCGFVVVVVDYRLVPQARFPSGGEDLALAIDWVRSNLRELGSIEDRRDLFIMGNSAGGIHLSTYLFGPTFEESRKRITSPDSESYVRLRGAVLLSVPLHFEAANPERKDVLEAYFGDRINEDCPFGLLKALMAERHVSEALPGVNYLILTGSLDPEDEILIPNRDFIKAWKANDSLSGSNLEVQVMDGHNHISPPFGLATGDAKDEDWGFQVAKFCTASVGQ